MARGKSSSSTATLALGLLLMTLVGQCYGSLRVGYYNKKCGKIDVEAVIFGIVRKHFNADKDTVADLVRMLFHDCMVNGCDASILLEGKNSEKTSPPNGSVSGFDIIEECKVALDKICPGVVSCADIIVIASRAAAFLGGAKWYYVECGRKDGRVSNATQALNNLPGPTIPIPAAVQLFAQLGLTKLDFVVLLGCHTVGTAHCINFQDRLYNFNGSGKSDSSIAASLLPTLKKLCPKNANSNNQAFLDQTPGSQFVMDNGFYKQIMAGKGILQVDQQMALDSTTKGLVKQLADDPKMFVSLIGPSMNKLARVGVKLTGEVRRGTCKKVNPLNN